MPQPQQRQIRATSATYNTAHGNTRSLTHRVRPGIGSESSWMLVRFVSWATTETPLLRFLTPWPQQELQVTHFYIMIGTIFLFNGAGLGGCLSFREYKTIPIFFMVYFCFKLSFVNDLFWYKVGIQLNFLQSLSYLYITYWIISNFPINLEYQFCYRLNSLFN